MSLPDGPRGPALYNLLRYALRPAEFFGEARRRYGPTFSAELAGLGTFVFLGDPDAIRDVFHGDPEVLRTGEANAFVAEIVGSSSLLTLDGEAHARPRRELIPPFHGDRLDLHATVMRDLCEREIARWPRGVPVNLEDSCREITLQAILRVVFGMREGAELDALAALVRRVMVLLSDPLAFAAPFVPGALLRLLPARREIDALQAGIDAALFRLIAAKRDRDGREEDVLAALLRMRHPDGSRFSDRELRDHLYTMLLAGHDTTAIAIAWAMGEILRHPAVLDRIRHELDEVAGSGPLELEHVRRLDYLEAAIKESMRLRPLVDFAVRLLKAPFSAGGVRYPAGITLAPCTLLVHLRADVYPEPEEFRPERFLQQRPPPYAWIPFGGGQRRCLGMNFALIEMQVVMATLLRRVRFAPPGAPPRVVRRGLFLAPSDWGRCIPA